MMWKRIKDFYSSNKYAVWWTAGYVAACWAIMHYMFNFNIFSATRWNQLWHAHLYGFAGFVFGILILAMIPLYIATTIVVARTRAPLFNFKLTIPEWIKTFFKNAFIQTPMDEPEVAPAPESISESISEPVCEPVADATTPEPQSPTPAPETIPAEMRVAYARARDNIARAQTSAFDLGHMTAPKAQVATIPDDEPSTSESMPIPTDFDIADTENVIGDTPIFTDIDFDDDDETNDEGLPANDIQTPGDTNEAVIKYLTNASIPFEIIDDIVVTNKFAIASHTDSDFWVADTESWFAAGKIRKSPIASIQSIAAARNLEPVLYLGADNIMDIDELRTEWKSAGIRVISDLDELK